MIEGVVHHCTEMEVDRQYVDSTAKHGRLRVLPVAGVPGHVAAEGDPRSEAFPDRMSGKPDVYPNLQAILTKAIDWELIRQQYDQMVKYVTAVRLGTAETESILRRFVRSNIQHPTYKAFAEEEARWRGSRVKDLSFLCQYLHSEAPVPGDQRRSEHRRAVEQRQRFYLICPSRRNGQQPPRGSRDQHARPAPSPELHGVHQHAHVAAGFGPAALARQTHHERSRRSIPLIWEYVNHGRFELDMEVTWHRLIRNTSSW